MTVLKRILAWVGLVFFNLPLAWAIIRRTLEFIGWSTAPEDAMGLVDKLGSIPFPVALICALAAWYAFLMWPSVERGWQRLAPLAGHTISSANTMGGASNGPAIDAAEPFPSIRVADYPVVLNLFEGRGRDRLFPLLEDERLTAWARPMGSGQPPLARLSGDTWRSHSLRIFDRNSDGTTKQTFIQTNARQESKFYDLHLSRAQLLRFWPNMDLDKRATSLGGDSSPRALAVTLDGLLKEGVRERNRLIPPLADFDYEAERRLLVNWSRRVVEKLECELVRVGERSRFETLGEYNAQLMSPQPISPQQAQIQTMWTEKFKRLRPIIDRLG